MIVVVVVQSCNRLFFPNRHHHRRHTIDVNCHRQNRRGRQMGRDGTIVNPPKVCVDVFWSTATLGGNKWFNLNGDIDVDGRTCFFERFIVV